MAHRLDYRAVSPKAIEVMISLENHLRSCGLEKSFLDLVKTRSSQLNGCAYYLDMHMKDARAAGETEQRLYALSAWRGTAFYTG